jgi:hypothetical protein
MKLLVICMKWCLNSKSIFAKSVVTSSEMDKNMQE